MRYVKIGLITLFIGILAAVIIYSLAWTPRNLWEKHESHRTLYITDEDQWSDLQEKVDSICPKLPMIVFASLGTQMNLHHNIHPGKYRIERKQALIELIRLLRSGEQKPVSVVVPEVKSIKRAIIQGTTSLQIDSVKMVKHLSQDTIWQNHPHYILPNTYEMYWDINPDDYMKRLYRESKGFWNNADTKNRLEQINMSAKEAYILASIVNRETNKVSEMDTIAGVYFNRLKIGMPLQADPTIKFIIGPHVKRILYKDLEIDSPYNTYKNSGLPPGPIGLSSMHSIEAVLNLVDHNYLYFCANPDKPGSHSFAKTYTNHLRNARKYQRTLN